MPHEARPLPEAYVPRGEIDIQVFPFRGRDLGDPPRNQCFAGRDELDDRRAFGVEIGFYGADESRPPAIERLIVTM